MKCGDCKYFEWIVGMSEHSVQCKYEGYCKRYPPEDTDKMLSRNDWCGEFQKKSLIVEEEK